MSNITIAWPLYYKGCVLPFSVIIIFHPLPYLNTKSLYFMNPPPPCSLLAQRLDVAVTQEASDESDGPQEMGEVDSTKAFW